MRNNERAANLYMARLSPKSNIDIRKPLLNRKRANDNAKANGQKSPQLNGQSQNGGGDADIVRSPI